MSSELLSVDQVAQILGLHPRTVRRFIREDRLKAKKVGKEWRILRTDLDVLTGREPSIQVQVGGSMQVSAVADVFVANQEEANRIFNFMLATVTAKGPEYGVVHYQSLYIKDERKARLMFWGDAAFIGQALITLQKISSTFGQPRERNS
jgi:excisionase family DNA binding protein